MVFLKSVVSPVRYIVSPIIVANGSGTINTNTKYYSFGGPGWTPLNGDWNADNKDEIGVYQNGNWYLDYNGNGFWDTGDKNYGFGAIGWTPVVGKW